jgi:two-component system NtrC family response regulator
MIKLGDLTSLRVLVVDDENVICDACELVLSEAGCRVDHETTGQSGITAIQDKAYDLVLLDLKLPDIDGMEVLRKIGALNSSPRVIIMTGYSSISNAVLAMKLGAADYLLKPFTDDELVSAIEKALSKH